MSFVPFIEVPEEYSRGKYFYFSTYLSSKIGFGSIQGIDLSKKIIVYGIAPVITYFYENKLNELIWIPDGGLISDPEV